jgi:hypothetical protein
MGKFNVFLTSTLVAGELLASHLGHFISRKRAPSTYWIGCVGPKTGLDDMDKRKFLTLLRLKNSNPSIIQPLASCYTDCTVPASWGWRYLQEILVLLLAGLQHFFLHACHFIRFII